MDLFEQTQVAVVAVLAREKDVAPVSAHGVGVPLWCGGLKTYICAIVIICSGLVFNLPAAVEAILFVVWREGEDPRRLNNDMRSTMG